MNKIRAIGFDYDRTITDEDLEISIEAVKSIKRARTCGIKTILVSGRAINFLTDINGRYGIADVVVAENGAILSFEKSGKKIRTSAYDTNFKDALCDADFPIEYGEVIASVRTEYERELSKLIKKKKMKLKLIRNIDAIMLMPPDVDKGAGVLKALGFLGVDKKNLAVIGDGENDMEMFSAAGTKVAVANAVEILKSSADVVCKKPYGAGVAEFIGTIIGC